MKEGGKLLNLVGKKKKKKKMKGGGNSPKEHPKWHRRTKEMKSRAIKRIDPRTK
jgi:hypothetical protein